MTVYSLRAEHIGMDAVISLAVKSLEAMFSAARLLGASDVRNGSEFSNGKMACGRKLPSKIG